MPDIAGGRFVVVGGASQVGSHIGEQLLAGGAREVVLFDNLSLGSSDMLQPLLADPRCTFVRGDMLRPSDLFDAFAGADGVFAVAALMATSIAENPWVGLDVNIRGLQNTLEACRCQRVKKVVISSSAGVYGVPSDVPTDEDSPLRWQSLQPSMTLYCASKVIGEGLAQLYRQRHGLDFVALRYTAVYGERQHRRALVGGHIADSCERIRRGEPPMVQGDGQHVFDYVHAGDVARANLLAMQSAVSGEGINICSGVETSQNRIVELVAQACGSTQTAVQRHIETGARLPSTARQAYSRDKALRLLAWEPQVSIEEGVTRVLRWVDERNAARA
jgi:UDP-glucose 4-epimerase